MSEDNKDTEYKGEDLSLQKNPPKDLIAFAKENEVAFREYYYNVIFPTLSKNQQKSFLRDSIKATNDKELVDFHEKYYGNTTAGTQSGIILDDSDYKRSNSKNPKYINKYRNDRFAPTEKVKRIREHHLIELLVAKYNLNIKTSLLLDKALGNVTEKNEEDGTRYAKDTSGSYSKLNETIQKQFFEEFIYVDETNKKCIGYKVLNSNDISKTLNNYILELEYEDKPSNADNNVEQYLQIKAYDYSNMSVYSKLHILKNLDYVEKSVLFVKMQHKQDIGNNGRRYNILNEIPRDDRKKISNLYGVDMESALQVIVYTKVKELDPTIELPFTKYYINNKKQIREEISQQLKWEIERTKKEITAIYQGRMFTKKKEEHQELEKIFIERDLIRELIFQTQTDKESKATKYAKVRTKEKIESKDKIKDAFNNYSKLNQIQQMNVRNTYMFFWWTYFEREAQNIIAKEFKYPKTLHDAVYTQREEEISGLDIIALEDEIFKHTKIPIKLSLD